MVYRNVSIKQLLIASGLTVALLSGCSTVNGFFNKDKPKETTTEATTTTDTSAATTTDTTSTDTKVVVDTTTESSTTPTTDNTTSSTNSSTTTSDEEGTFHTIVKGDYLYKIAKKYKCSIADLVKWNNLKNEKHVLMPGQKLRVSAP